MQFQLHTNSVFFFSLKVKIDMEKHLVILDQEFEVSANVNYVYSQLSVCFFKNCFIPYDVYFPPSLLFRTSQLMIWEVNFLSDSPDILTECAVNVVKSSRRSRVSTVMSLSFLDSSAHSLLTATNMSMMMEGFLILCVSYSPVRWVRC